MRALSVETRWLRYQQRRRATAVAWSLATLCLANLAGAQQLAPPAPMRAGGLAPPPSNDGPVPATAPPTAGAMTWQQLEDAQSRDSGRGLEFVYVDAAAGLQLVSLGALSSGAIVADGSATTALGPTLGLGAGARLLYFTVGPRFQWAHFADWNLWTLNLEVGWHIPLGRLEPYGVVGAGFAKLPRAGAGAFADDRGVSVSGFNVRLGGGFDYYLSNAFTIGAAVDAQLLRLARSGVALQPSDSAAAAVFASDASSVGLALTGAAVLGLHY